MLVQICALVVQVSILWIVMLIHDQVDSICEKIGAKK